MRIGFDYGGTKIAGIAIGDDGKELARARVPTPRFDYDAGIVAIKSLMEKLEAESGVAARSVGIGVPGAVDRETGEISMGNSVWINGRDLSGDLQAALGKPVSIANDANCFALSEAVDGAGAGASVVFGAILGTGVGGGVVVNGKVIEGVNAIGGEWGHIPLPDPLDDERPGPKCSCGKFGHAESWLSGPSLAADYARRIGVSVADGPTAPEVVSLSENGNAFAEETLVRFEDRLGRSLAVIVNFLDPDVIVMGGGLSNIDRIYDNVPALIKPHVFGDRFKTRFVRNLHGDSSGVRGAAWL